MKKLEIHIDHFAPNPFTDWGCLPTLFSNHRDYSWKGCVMAEGGYNSLAEEFENRLPNVVSVPVYLYRHSGDTVSTKPFSCPWDSMQLGYMFYTKEQIRENYGRKRVTQKLEDKVRKNLEANVQLLDDYVRGEVYGFKVIDEEGEEVDSCWGFYGQDFEGIANHLDPDDFPDKDLVEVVEEAFEDVKY